MYIVMYKLKHIFFESKAKYFSIAIASVKYFNETIGKKNKTGYDENMLDLTLGEFKDYL